MTCCVFFIFNFLGNVIDNRWDKRIMIVLKQLINHAQQIRYCPTMNNRNQIVVKSGVSMDFQKKGKNKSNNLTIFSTIDQLMQISV